MRGEGAAFEPSCPVQSSRNLVGGAGSYPPAVGAVAFFPHRLALHFDAMRVLDQPVEDASGDGRISDLGVPAGNRQLAGQPAR